MGCDIHLSAEIRVDGKWQRLSAEGVEELKIVYEYNNEVLYEIYSGRDYDLFGRLAGVRRDGPAIAEPRGIPKDTTEQVRAEYEQWSTDAHSASYLTLAELLAAEKKSPLDNYWFTNKTMPFLRSFMARDIADAKDIRIIFWFDN